MKQPGAMLKSLRTVENRRRLRRYTLYRLLPKKRFQGIPCKPLLLNDVYENAEFVYEHYPVRSEVYVPAPQFVSQMKRGLNNIGFQPLALQSDDLAQVLYLCRSEWLTVCGQS